MGNDSECDTRRAAQARGSGLHPPSVEQEEEGMVTSKDTCRSQARSPSREALLPAPRFSSSKREQLPERAISHEEMAFRFDRNRLTRTESPPSSPAACDMADAFKKFENGESDASKAPQNPFNQDCTDWVFGTFDSTLYAMGKPERAGQSPRTLRAAQHASSKLKLL